MPQVKILVKKLKLLSEDVEYFKHEQNGANGELRYNDFSSWTSKRFTECKCNKNVIRIRLMEKYKQNDFKNSWCHYTTIYLIYKQNFPKKSISYSLTRTHTCAYQGLRYVSFLENSLQVLDEWALMKLFVEYRHLTLCRSSHLLVFCKKDILKNFEKLSWKRLFQGPAALLKMGIMS